MRLGFAAVAVCAPLVAGSGCASEDPYAAMQRRFEQERLAERQRFDAVAQKSSDPANVSRVAVMVSHYDANEVRGDQLMKGFRREFVGVVEHVGKGLDGTPYVVLGDTYGLSDTFRRVQCFFRTEAGLDSLQSSRLVLVRGTGAGLFGNVLMKDCELLAVE